MGIVLGLNDTWLNPLGISTAPGLEQQNNQPSTVLPKQDMNTLIDVVLGEAAGEGPEGMTAVASVIKNRATSRNKSAAEIVKEPDQFTAYLKPGPDALKAMRDPAMRAEAEKLINGVFSGEMTDPTGGADHYHANYVKPSWSDKLDKTATIGRHEFYTSGRKPKPSGDGIVVGNGFMPEDGLGLNKGANPFEAVLAGENVQNVQNDTTTRRKGLQALVSDEPAPDLSSTPAGTLTFLHKGQDQIAPEFRSLLEGASQDLGRPLSITSGFRSGSHPVEREKRTPGEHSHGTASDIDMRGMDEAQRTALVDSLITRGAKRFITYTNTPDMLHVDMKDQLGNGTLWFMHDKSARNIDRAPGWFKKIANGDRPAPGSTLTAYADDSVTSPAPRGQFEGLLEPGNLDLEHRPQVKLKDGSVATVRSASFNIDGKEVLLPTVSDDGRLLSNDEALAQFKQTGKHLGIFDTPAHATTYAEALHDAQAKFVAAGQDKSIEPPIIIDDSYKPANDMRLGAEDPFATERAAMVQTQQDEAAQREADAAAKALADNEAAATTTLEKLDADSPGRYKVMPEDEATAFHDQWEKDNRSTSIGGDASRHLSAGNADLGLMMDEAVRYIPGIGPKIADGMASVDEWFTGKPMKQRLAEEAERQRSSTTPEDQAAIQKKAYDPDKPLYIGDALKDPRWYVAQAAESVPGMAATMAPSTVMARATYLKALAAGLTEREAAARAAKTALIAGGLGEGTLGGAQSSLAVKEKIAAIPRETLLQSEAVQAMIKTGMSEDDAITAVTNDAATQAFIYSGAITGLFGGMGDRVLTKIIAEGVGGGIVKRVASSAVREGLAEGAEETAQNAGQTIAENKAMQTVKPDQDLMEGVPEAVVSGLATGTTMGATLGAPTGVISKADTESRETDPAEETVVDPSTPPVEQPTETEAKPPLKKGGMAEAIEKGRKAAEDAALKAKPASKPDLPPAGSTVLISEGGVEMMGTIDSWENGEAIIMDRSTGEILQVPPSAIKEVMHRPGDPIGPDRKSELPPREATKKATDAFVMPDPGKRVIVDAEGVDRFAGTVERYEGDDALIRTDDGKTVQVPVADLRVDGLTKDQREARDLADNPPVEREKPEQTPTRRTVANRTVEMPDERHARLYDLARERLTSKRLLGKSSLDMNDVMPAEQKKLAEEFGVTPDALGQMADDYRYRVERAGKEAKSDLPVKMYGVNEQRLKQWQNEAKKAAKRDAAADTEIDINSGQKTHEEPVTSSAETEITGNKTGQENGVIDPLAAAANQAATSPTNDLPEPSEAQKEAGNYKLGHVKLGGLDLSIENPAGSSRKGKSRSGKAWEVAMKSHYGYIKGTIGRDKDHIDVFVRPGTEALDDSSPVFVVDQRDPARGRFDEHKVMLGFDSQKAARDGYLENYDKKWKGLGAVTATTLGEFKQWLKEGDTQTAFATKWFPDKAKAETYIANEKLGDRYEVVPEGLKYEVRRKAKAKAKANSKVTINVTSKPPAKSSGQKVRKPASLIEFLARNGGLRDDHNELAAIGLKDRKTGFVAGAGPLIRPKGMHPDKAREMAAQAGYLPMDSSPTELYEALDADARSGRQLFSQQDDEAAAKWREAQGIEEQDADLDAALAFEAEIRERLRSEGFPVEGADIFIAAVARAMEAGLPFEEALESSYIKTAARVLEDLPPAAKMELPFFGDDDEVQSGAAHAGRAVDRSDRENGDGTQKGATEGTGPDGPAGGESKQEARPGQVAGSASGPPAVVYHGTSSGGFDTFDTYGGSYGLFGSGGYFTEDPAIALEYTRKGKGESPAVYEASLDVQRALDMDAPANMDEWRKAFDEYLDEQDYRVSKTNEDMYRAVEEFLSGDMIPKWEGSEIMQDGVRSMGYDAITHVGGGRHKASKGTKHRVWIVFDPEQVRNLRPQEVTTEEAGADNKPQLVIPGAERASDAIMAQRHADAPLMAQTAQKDPGGLFSDERDQPSLLQADRVDRTHVAYDVADFEAIAKIVADVAGLEDIEWPGRIRVPHAKDWGIHEAIDAAGQYDTARDAIVISRTLGSESTAYHEAFHRLQNLFLTKNERALLKAEVGRLRRIVAAKHGWENTRKMSQIELEAEAFAMYASGEHPPKIHVGLRAAWNRIMEMIRRTLNYLAGRGFVTMEDVFDTAKTGEMKDRAPNPDPALAVGKVYQPAWHGSPHSFDKFSTEHIGNGEGNQSFGWGLYFAGKKEVAEFYRNTLSRGGVFNYQVNGEQRSLSALRTEAIVQDLGLNMAESYPAQFMLDDIRRGLDIDAAARQAKKRYAGWPEGSVDHAIEAVRAANPTIGEGGRLYKVDIPDDDQLLNWRAPLASQPAAIKSAIRKMTPPARKLLSTTMGRFRAARLRDILAGKNWDTVTADEFYSALALHLAGDRNDRDRFASEALRLAGIPGHRYLDQLSRSEGEGTSNYVIYDDSAVSVEQFYSIPPKKRAAKVDESRIISEVKGKLTDLTPALLGAVPLNYFPELKRPNMTAVDDYMRVKRAMDAYRGNKHAEADETAQEWLKYTRLGPAKAKALSSLMHETTLVGIDPSETDDETKAKPGFAELRKKYMALPPAGRQLYNKVRDTYARLAEELDQILLDNVRKAMMIEQERAEADYQKEIARIEKSGLKGSALKQAKDTAEATYKAASTRAQWSMKARLTKLRLAFESSRVAPPYFPLGRFGKYFAAVRDVDGTLLSFSKFEKAADRDRAAAQLRKDHRAATVSVGMLEDKQNVREAMDPRLIAEIETILGTAKVSDDVMDEVWQRYLESMPDLSARKRFIHRSGTAGFAEDALRVFSSHTFHAAHQMAKTKYGMELGELVSKTVDQAEEADDQTKGMTLANELKRRHQWVMNPTGGPLAQLMTSTAFVWMLAASPAAAIVNLSQTAILGIPVLAGQYGGMTKASAALLRASKDIFAGKGFATNGKLTADEKQAMAAFYESGLIDRTQSHDLAGVGDTGVKYSPVRAKVMGIISWGFHHTERLNREATALAAYRMARAAGESQSSAIDSAHDLTYRTHFDFSNSSRPRYMQNDFMKVALVFRSYQINFLYRLFRDIHQSVKGQSPQVRREARYQLAGVLGMQALLAGVTGVAGFSLAMSLASLVFGDDDDPMDYETKFKADVIDILGPQLGGMVLNGVPGHYLGVDLTSRIGMPDLWFRSPGRELQGRAEYQYWISQMLGAVPSIGERMYAGFNVAADGDVARGVEMAAPKFAADMLKVYRYATEGLTNLKGDEIVPAEDIDVADLLKQGLGFSPAKISEAWDRKSALENAEQRVMDKRKRLVNRFALSVAMEDAEARAEVIADIKAFNAGPVNRTMPITKETLQRSIATRARNASKREDGALIENPALSKILRESLPDRVY